MQEILWKCVDNYCLIQTNMSGANKKDKLLELACMKVENQEIVDTFYTKINPNFKDLQKQSEYSDYFNSPLAEDAGLELQKFMGRKIWVGWDVRYDIYHLEKEARFFYEKRIVDVAEPYYFDYGNIICPASIENMYVHMYKGTSKYIEYDYNNVLDKCKALMQLYESRKSFNRELTKRRLSNQL